MRGIDISQHNGNINFSSVKNSNIDVIIIKATEGVNYVDPMCEAHYNNAVKYNFNIGFYHFMSEKTSPSQQAVDFWNKIKNKKFNVLPCLDIETNRYGRSRREISDRCIEFLNKFKDISGLDCMIYTGGYFGRDNLDDRVKQYKGWIAHYGVSKPMETGFNVVGHQYTGRGRVNGVNGDVDLDNFDDEILLSRHDPEDGRGSVQRDSWVARLQEECNRQGFSNQVVDGIPGPNTLNGCPLVRKGARGNITRLIQEKLVSFGYSTNGLDGIFGSGTKTAVIQFQNKSGIASDGIVGRNTWYKLIYS